MMGICVEGAVNSDVVFGVGEYGRRKMEGLENTGRAQIFITSKHARFRRHLSRLLRCLRCFQTKQTVATGERTRLWGGGGNS